MGMFYFSDDPILNNQLSVDALLLVAPSFLQSTIIRIRTAHRGRLVPVMAKGQLKYFVVN